MATDKVVLDVEVNSDKAGKSLSDLKKEFKEGQKELSNLTQGTKEYVAQLEKLGGIKDDIGDLNNEIKAFNPEGKVQALGKVVGGLAGGFAAAQGAVALFGVENKDLEKTLVKVQAAMAFQQGIQGLAGLGDAFKVLGNIIKANPIFLIVGAVVAIGTALFALKDKISIVGDAFDAIGKAIGYVIDKVKEFTDWIGISSFALDEAAEKTIAAQKKQGDAIVDRYDREIKLAQAAGENTVDMERKKQEAIIKTAQLEGKLLIETALARGEYNDGEEARITALIKAVSDASLEIQIINAKEKKQLDDDNKKLSEKNKAELDKRKEDERKHIEDIEAMWQESFYDAREARMLASIEKEKLRKEQELIDLNSQNDLFLEAEKDFQTEKTQVIFDSSLIHRKITEDEFQHNLDIAQQSNDSLMNLSNLLFDLKRQNMQKGSAAELRLAKKQFQINKALAITNTIISTVQGMIKAIATNPPPSPLGFIGAALTGVAGTIATAKIATQKFMGDSGGGSGGGSTPSLGSAASAANVAPPSQGSTQLNPDGTIRQQTNTQQPQIRAYVVESEISKSQRVVSSIEANAKL